jgi:adenylate cyclase
MGELDPTGVLQSLDLGVAVTDPLDWRILFENGRFFELFPPDPTAGLLDGPDTPVDVVDGDREVLAARMPSFKAERAAERLARKRPFTFEAEAASAGRTVPVRVTLRPLPDEPDDRVVVECKDVSKEMEIQYMLDSYSSLAERNARDLEKEKERVEKLLLNIMPKAVLEELKDYGATTPQRFDAASIVMLDFVGFTDMAISEDAAAIITELNDIFSTFDRIVETFNCERLKTIGDAYIAVSGVPESAPEHAQSIARVALRMRRYLERRNAAHTIEWRARFGINTGPVIGSLVGIQRYVYDLFGPGVNLAARMEALSEPMRITVSQATRDLLEDDFVLSERGEFDVKGFGPQKLYYLEGELGRGRR